MTIMDAATNHGEIRQVLLSFYNCRISDGASRYIVEQIMHINMYYIILMKKLTYDVSMEYLLVSSSIGYIRLEAESMFYIQINSIWVCLKIGYIPNEIAI